MTQTATAVEQLSLPDSHASRAALPTVRQANALAASAASNHEAGNFIQIIAQAARDPSVDIEKMERLWQMHERLKNRAAEEAFNAAMNLAQSEMGRVSADAVNTQTRSRYATYGNLDAALRPVYTRHGFALSFDTGDGAPEGYTRVLAYVSHSAGHTRTYKADMPADGKGAKGGDVMTKTHASGASMSYGMRYLLKLIFNVAIGEDDNDGNGDGGGSGSEGATRSYTPEQKITETLLDSGRAASMEGSAALTKWWSKLSPKEQKLMNPHFGAMRKAARLADQEAGRGE